MRRVFLALTILALIASPVYAQWHNPSMANGRPSTYRVDVASEDIAVTMRSVNLDGYNKARLDFDISGASATIKYNVQCSSDSVWYSGDSVTLTATGDSWDEVDLIGCPGGYNVWIESISAGTVDIDITPVHNY